MTIEELTEIELTLREAFRQALYAWRAASEALEQAKANLP